MSDDKRSEAEIIRDAYAPDHMDKIAPVQGYPGGIPWPIHLEAYEVYCAKWGKQTALINLDGRGCRGGFSIGELDDFIPGWRDRVAAFGKMKTRIAALDVNTERMGEALAALSGKLKSSGWLEITENHIVYETVVRAWSRF